MWLKKALNTLADNGLIKTRGSHLKARLIVSLILLLLSIIGVFITVFAPTFAWHYWILVVPLFAALCIWLSWHISRSNTDKTSTIAHEVVHWVALLVAVYLVSTIVSTGIINYLAGALFVLILLAFGIFLAGLQFDSMFMLIGILLGILAACSAFFVKYVIVILIPIAIIIAGFFIWHFMRKKKSSSQ